VWTIAGILTAAPALAAPIASAPEWSWLDVVREHVPGADDPALAALAAMPPESIEDGLGRVFDAHLALLTRALVLHTDLAIREQMRFEQEADAGSAGRSIVLVDGRNSGRRRISAHWGYAQRVAGLLAERKDPDARQLASLWFHTVCLYFQDRSECGLLHAYVTLAVSIWPGDARLRLFRATLHQAYADRRVQRLVASKAQQAADSSLRVGDVRSAAGTRLVRLPLTAAAPRTAAEELALAEADLRRALQLDPDMVEARVRLAHVLVERGRADEASRVATAALDTDLPPFFEVYASLVLGRSEARLGRFDEARRAFERAAARAPTSQAPRIGLAQVALAQGHSADALAQITDVSGTGRGTTDEEAWAIYFRVHDPGADRLLAVLRSQIR
jgi:tetratricopeptide (TPR) repeat protein